ncbi:hypothetical protein BaRGS_00007846 [Batillaria attramentaria]|uniref:Ig-like domain-containing protein n=1 Tax=Batillaria attramentaria TaxID=370345 RepID=A0ABD0LNC8_9CAEN
MPEDQQDNLDMFMLEWRRPAFLWKKIAFNGQWQHSLESGVLCSALVFWLKDNVELDVQKDINFIISSEGSLIINQARLQDSGNYTCGAVNQASRRLSDSASLVVYLDGQWTAWSEWSECSATCGKGKKRRTRTCTDPAPLNGGDPCLGDQQAFVDCTSLCPG